jgi:hypothetical protein
MYLGDESREYFRLVGRNICPAWKITSVIFHAFFMVNAAYEQYIPVLIKKAFSQTFVLTYVLLEEISREKI